MNTTKLKLTNPTDDELSAAVAEHVLKWRRCKTELHAKFGGWVDANKQFVCYGGELPPYATSADAVLPLLEKWKATHPLSNEGCHIARYPGEWVVSLPADSWDDPAYQGQSPTFPRAACIALLRANGIEVEQTAPAQK